MTDRYDVIVVGGGAMGTAAARNLALRGRHTLLLERFTFGHDNGSSGGPTRIFRYAYQTPAYVKLALAAREPWDELQDAAGEGLLRVTGGIDTGEEGRARGGLLEAAGVPVEWLEPAAVRERWPELRLPDDAGVSLFQGDAGVVRAARTVEVQARLAAEAGATVHEDTTVTAVEPLREGVEVRTATGASYAAPVAVVAVGAWGADLLRTAGLELVLRPSLEQATYFDGCDGLPAVIDWSEDAARPPYLVPDPFEPGAFKVGIHMAGPPADPDARTFDPDPVRETRAVAYARSRVPRARGVARTDTCLYTVTPDEDFVLDRVGALVVASPCSGHGFKFAPLFGRVIADLATGKDPGMPLGSFRVDRAALRPVT